MRVRHPRYVLLSSSFHSRSTLRLTLQHKRKTKKCFTHSLQLDFCTVLFYLLVLRLIAIKRGTYWKCFDVGKTTGFLLAIQRELQKRGVFHCVEIQVFQVTKTTHVSLNCFSYQLRGEVVENGEKKSSLVIRQFRNATSSRYNLVARTKKTFWSRTCFFPCFPPSQETIAEKQQRLSNSPF